MQSVNRALLLGVMVLLAAAVACGGGEEEAAAAAAAAAAEAEIEVSPEARAAAERLSERLAAGISLVPTQRGQAEIGYTQPVARRGTGSERGFTSRRSGSGTSRRTRLQDSRSTSSGTTRTATR